MGCNSTCSYCIVPAVRGREQSRRPGDILAEVTRLAADGVREVTLLGQNVNSWGRDLVPDIRTEFGELLRACDAVPGIERIRFTSPHPKDFREPVIAAIADCDAVCEHVHLPLQSGSNRILKAMRRTYTAERYLTLVERLRDAIPDLALGTDVIVGFPGESDLDFEQTLAIVEHVRYDSAFTFIYSPRQGTDAAVITSRSPTRSSTSDSSGWSRWCNGSRRSGMRSGSGGSRRCSSRARAAPTRRSFAAAPAATRWSTSPARASGRRSSTSDRKRHLDDAARPGRRRRLRLSPV